MITATLILQTHGSLQSLERRVVVANLSILKTCSRECRSSVTKHTPMQTQTLETKQKGEQRWVMEFNREHSNPERSLDHSLAWWWVSSAKEGQKWKESPGSEERQQGQCCWWPSEAHDLTTTTTTTTTPPKHATTTKHTHEGGKVRKKNMLFVCFIVILLYKI